MNTNMHFMHPPKIVQIGWGHHVDFCFWKKSAITFGEGCIHIFPGQQQHAKLCIQWFNLAGVRGNKKKHINFHVDLERTLGKLPGPDVKMWDCVFSLIPGSIFYRMACLSTALENSQLCVMLRALLSDGNLPNILICRFLSKRAFMLEITHGIPTIHEKL